MACVTSHECGKCHRVPLCSTHLEDLSYVHLNTLFYSYLSGLHELIQPKGMLFAGVPNQLDQHLAVEKQNLNLLANIAPEFTKM